MQAKRKKLAYAIALLCTGAAGGMLPAASALAQQAAPAQKIEKIEVVSDRHVKITCKYETLDFYGVQFETRTKNN